ncbi:MAG: hypothetical protein WDN08_10615 [Rhizomicrobium sp.]
MFATGRARPCRSPSRRRSCWTLQVDSPPRPQVAVRYTAPLRAPLAQGTQIGTVVITAPDFPGLTVPLYVAQPVDEIGFFGRMALGLKALFGSR